MLYRKVQTVLDGFKKGNKALLITGARQVGKSFIEINFIKDETAKKAGTRLFEWERYRIPEITLKEV